MINVPDEVPGGVVIIIMLLAAIAVSVLWAAIPAIFKCAVQHQRNAVSR